MKDINKIFITALNALFLILPRGSKKDLAEAMHLSTGHFSDILSGRRGTSEEKRRELCYLIRDNYLAGDDFHYSDVLDYGQAILENHPSVRSARQALYGDAKFDRETLINEWLNFLDTYDDETIEESYQFLPVDGGDAIGALPPLSPVANKLIERIRYLDESRIKALTNMLDAFDAAIPALSQQPLVDSEQPRGGQDDKVNSVAADSMIEEAKVGNFPVGNSMVSKKVDDGFSGVSGKTGNIVDSGIKKTAVDTERPED